MPPDEEPKNDESYTDKSQFIIYIEDEVVMFNEDDDEVEGRDS
jgi:hypothetical protein